MNDVFRAFINLYVFPSGRRLACAREVARRAVLAEAPSVQALAFELANEETVVRELDHARKKAAAQAKHTAAAMALDRQVDACLVEQLAQLQPLYAAELGAVPVGLPDYQAIVGGYRACQDKLVALVVEILAETRNAPSKAEALLAPIQFHQDAIGRYLRDRRKIRDVDPATGAEIDDSMPAT